MTDIFEHSRETEHLKNISTSVKIDGPVPVIAQKVISKNVKLTLDFRG